MWPRAGVATRGRPYRSRLLIAHQGILDGISTEPVSAGGATDKPIPGRGGVAISRLTDLALTKFAITLLLSVAALVAGGVAATRLNVEMMPEMNFPMVTVIAAYPGASPQDVAERVTEPIEQAIAGTPGLKQLQSTSAEGISVVIAELEFGQDGEEAESAIQSALAGIPLPDGAQSPRTARVNINDLPVVQVSLSGELPPLEMRRIASEKLVSELSRLPGVYSVDLLGGEEYHVEVELDPEKAAEKGISFQQVAGALQGNSLALPGGSVEVGESVVSVRTLHRFETLEALREMVVGVNRNSGAMVQAPPPFQAPPQLPPQAGVPGQMLPQAPTSQAPQGAAPPSAPSAPPQAPPSSPNGYLIQPGDTLGEIAARHGITLEALAAANGVADPDLIYAGQSLVIPSDGNSAGRAPGNSSPPAEILTPTPLPQPAQPEPVRLREIASVTLKPAPVGGISRTNGRPSVLLSVSKTQDANTVSVAEGVIQKLDELSGELGAGVETEIVVDQSRDVVRSVQGLSREGLLGMLFAVLVIFLFLRSLRGTLIAAVSIPLSIALAFLGMAWQGFTLNVMTLAGLAVAVGRVLDDGIVVLENAYRYVERGETPAAAVRAATAEVAVPVAASTATTVAVFLPLAFVGGIIGQAFRPFALTVAFALVASLLVALTVVPVLCMLLLRRKARQQPQEERPLLIRDLLEEPSGPRAVAAARQGNGHNGHTPDPPLLRAYTPALKLALRFPIPTLALAAVLLVGSLSLLSGIPTAFLPSDGEKLLMVRVEPPAAASRDAVSRKAAEVERLLDENPEVALYHTSVGDDTGTMATLRAAFSGGGGAGATLMVRLHEDADLEITTADLRESLAEIQGDSRINVSTQQSSGMSRLRLVLSGSDPVDVELAAARVERELRDMPDLANLSSHETRGAEEISIRVDPNRAAELGLTTAQVAGAIRGMVAGQTVGSFDPGDGAIDIRLLVPRDSVASTERLGELPFGAPETVPLSEIAEIRQQTGPAQVTRVGQSPAVEITADLIAEDAGAVSQEVKKRIEALRLPGGVEVDYGGVMQQMAEGFANMGIGQAVGVVLVFATMALFFNSVIDPLVILLSLPLAAVGALPALYLTGHPLSMSGMIGMLMLIGIVVTNAIVLVDFARRLMREGLEPRSALLEAGRTRLRPILMTALTTILALVPLALGMESGSIIAAELAVVVMGGLISSTFLTLLVVPAAYRLVRRRTTAG